jgi:DNA repair protein RadC
MKQGPLFALAVIRLQVVKEVVEYYGNKKISCPSDAAEVAKKFLGDADREMFITINLSTANGINSIHVVSMGSVDRTTIHPRECFKAALLSNASSIILAHNHPSGTLQPSAEDKAATSKLKQCAELLELRVLDHVIVSDSGYFSFSENGIL